MQEAEKKTKGLERKTETIEGQQDWLNLDHKKLRAEQ
jgi:hypothetical protein